jgi:hypothetical protein
MKESYKVVPFPVFQAHCGERNFLYAGKPGMFNVSCRLPSGPERCNPDVCPIWNSTRVKDPPRDLISLREINQALRGPVKD